ncbi:MarR family transcriptional regulator [Thermopolyspora sp. NPDC052614]|uniref:MarR family winged helix-turn-helix transcriptional regulator n=1 Tax=Thermopolyspora sp. NPDC052614 TaxID=3155682 RepID=UPI003432CEA9
MRPPLKPPIAYLLAYAATLAARHAEEELRPHDLTVRQFGLLMQLRLEPALTMSELARQLGVTRQSLHEMTAELERTGHLRRLPGMTGRTRRLELTPRTERAILYAQATLLESEPDFLSGLAPHEIETLRDLLRRALAGATDDESWLP